MADLPRETLRILLTELRLDGESKFSTSTHFCADQLKQTEAAASSHGLMSPFIVERAANNAPEFHCSAACRRLYCSTAISVWVMRSTLSDRIDEMAIKNNSEFDAWQVDASQHPAVNLGAVSRTNVAVNRGLRPIYSDTTQLNSTRRRVELSCVAINGPTSSRQLLYVIIYSAKEYI